MSRSLPHWRVIVVAVAILSAVLPVPSPAVGQAEDGSIVFLLGGNVWRLDGNDVSTSTQLTEGGNIDSIAQDEQGSMIAFFDDFKTAVRLAPDGSPASDPFVPDGFAAGIYSPNLSPSGELFTYEGIVRCDDTSFELCRYVNVRRTDGGDIGADDTFIPGAQAPSFYDDDHIVFSDAQANIAISDVGGGSQPWFEDCEEYCATLGDVEISPDNQRVAVAVGVSIQELALYDMNAAPPALPDGAFCRIPAPSGDDYEITDISWSPDGTQLVFAEYLFDGGFNYTGIWHVDGIGTASCAELIDSVELIIPGAEASDWSAAPFGQDVSPPPPPPPGTGLIPGGRLDGGGNADPVAQAIATSQFLFADGSAQRVVLATADRFPDALAGAALAGPGAPILLTSGLDGLDARVTEEIRRVTGGDGTVLVLGGTAAVSEQAAGEASAAAGGHPCADPLPAGCRYAGSGREHTAALIAETVLAERGADRVLVARGDEFADAITGGAYAAAAGVPVLLTPPDQVNDFTRGLIEQHGIQQVVVLGGTAAVDEATYQALPGSTKSRVAASERTGTAAAIADQLWPSLGNLPGGAVLVNVRDAQSWQTALTAAVASARFLSPQVGVEDPPAGLSEPAMASLRDLGGPVMVFGSTDQVSDDQLTAAVAAAAS